MSNTHSDNFRVIIDNILTLLISPTTWQSISQSSIVTSYSYFLIQATDICRKYHGISILDIVEIDNVKLVWEELREMENQTHFIEFLNSVVEIIRRELSGEINLSSLKKPFTLTQSQENQLISSYQKLTSYYPKLYQYPVLLGVIIIMGIQNLANFIAPFFENISGGDKIYSVINQIILHFFQSKNDISNIVDFIEYSRIAIISLAKTFPYDSQKKDTISSQELLTSSHDSIKDIENLDIERIKKDKFYNQKTNQSFNNVFRQFRLTSNQSLSTISGSSDSDIKKETSVSPKRKPKPLSSHKENPSILTDYSEDDKIESSPNIIQSNMPSFTDLQDDLTILQNDSNASSEELNKLTHHLMQESHTNHECTSQIPSTEFDFSDAMSVLNDSDLLNILLKNKK